MEMKCIPWEPWEVDFLREVAGYMPPEQIAEKLDRTISSIWNKASRIEVKLKYRSKTPWTKSELSLFQHHSAKEISALTSRSIFSVRSQRYKLSRNSA